MITVKIFKRSDDFEGFQVSGHAGYADSGYDIICAAVSVLTLNTANSIETLTGDRIEDYEEERSMILGLQQIEANYDEPYVKVVFSEV